MPSDGKAELTATAASSSRPDSPADRFGNRSPTPWTGVERRAEERGGINIALKDSEIRYRRLFEAAKDGIMILDGETSIVIDANPSMCTLLECPWDAVIGNTLWELGPFRDAATIKQKFRELRHTDLIRYDDLPVKTKSGETEHVEIVANRYVAGGKDVVQVNVREITDRFIAERDARNEHESMAALLVILKKRDEQMRVINRMNELLQSCTSAEEAYKVIALLAGELFESRPGACAIVNPRDGRLDTVARWGGETRMQSLFGMEDCWAIRRGHAHEASASEGRLWCAHFKSQPEGGTYCVPLTVQGETLGLLTIEGESAAGGDALQNDHQLAHSMGEAIKLSLSNLRLRATLKEQATHDALTGLYNVRYLQEYLPRELHRSARAGSALCIAMIDLDHFKRLNDTLGHHAGDVVLREIGTLLAESLRKSDMAIRYGGEEFLLVLPDSTVEDAKRCVDQVRESVRKIAFSDLPGAVPPLTLSVGIAVAGEHGTTAGALIRAADMALYAAKRAGRDRVVVYEG